MARVLKAATSEAELQEAFEAFLDEGAPGQTIEVRDRIWALFVRQLEARGLLIEEQAA